MYSNPRPLARRLRDEDEFRAVMLESEHMTARVAELVAHGVVVLFLGMCLSWVESVYSRALFILTTAVLRAIARAKIHTPRVQFLVK